jgi:hypothetical protein
MLEFSPIFGKTDEVELTDAELEAIHGGRWHHGGGYFGGPYGGFYGYGYMPTEVLLLVPTPVATVPSNVTTAPSPVDSTATTAPSTVEPAATAAPSVVPPTTTAPAAPSTTPQISPL